MISTKRKRNARKVRVDPFFVDVADRYRANFEKEFGFPLPRTVASRQMAEAFDKLVKVNGMPVLQKKGSPKKRSKKKNCIIVWEFDH